MSFGGQKTTKTENSTQSSNPMAAAQPGVNGILGAGTDWMNKGGAQYYGGQTYADLTAPQMQGIDQLQQGGNSAGAQSYFGDVINGKYLDPSTNPALQGQLDAVAQNVMPQIGSAFTKAGMYGSTPNQTALAQGLSAGMAAPIFQNYQQERGMQQQAASGAPGMNQQIAGQQIAAGGMLQADKQAQIDADMARWNYNQNLPLQTANQAAGLINPIASQYKTTTGNSTNTTQQNSSPLQQALGVGMMGASMFGSGGMFPGVGKGLGSFFGGMGGGGMVNGYANNDPGGSYYGR